MILFFPTILYAVPCPIISEQESIPISTHKTKKNSWLTLADISSKSHTAITIPPTKNTSVFIRTEDDQLHIGYAATLTTSTLQIHRIESGERIPITPELSFSPTSKEHTLHILQNHEAMEALLCIKGKKESHARLRWEDNAYPQGSLHIISDNPIQQEQISYTPTSSITPALWPQDIVGTEVLLSVDPEQELHPILQEHKIEDPMEPGTWIVLPNRSLLPQLKNHSASILNIHKHIPYWAKAEEEHNNTHQQAIEAKLVSIAQKNPAASLHHIGSSRQGLPIWALQIGTEPFHEKPSILLWGGTHGNDLSSIQSTMNYITTLLHPKDGLTKLWRENLNIWIIPLLNVDGNQNFWFRSSHSGTKNHWDANDDGTRETLEGTLLHHNTTYSFLHSPADSRGPNPESEPEIQALHMLAQRITPTAAVSWSSAHDSIAIPSIQTNSSTYSDTKKIIENLLSTQYNPTTLQQYMSSDHTGIHNELLVRYGTHAFALPIQENTEENTEIIEMILNHALAGPAIRVLVQNEQGSPIQANINITSRNSEKQTPWKTRRLDGFWMYLLPKGKPQTIEVHAQGYTSQTIRVHPHSLYRIRLKEKSIISE